ncbi:MAG: hypothetical protein ABI599_08690 [Flavobacteriales bacterium]
MGARITFESDQALVEIDEQSRLVSLIWKGHAAGEQYRAPSIGVLKAVQDHGMEYFLSDARRMGLILYDDRAWSEREIIPKLIEAGLKRIAIVSSSDGLNLIAVDNMVNTIPTEAPLSVAFFDDPSAAQTWLLQKDSVDVSLPERAKGV